MYVVSRETAVVAKCVCGKSGGFLEALQKVTSGDAPIFVKVSRRQNPESFSSGQCLVLSFQSVCETCIAAGCEMGNKQISLSLFLRPGREKDGNEQSTMHAQYMGHAV
jgi:hypothetical protein